MRIRIHPAFGIYLVFIALLSGYSDCLAILFSLLLHESCHYAAARLIGEQISQLELTPFGGMMQYREGKANRKGLSGVFVHACGPLSNYAFLLLAGIPAIQRLIPYEILKSLIHTNASMFIINMLPVLPLDGGNIVFCLGYYFFPVAKLVSFLGALGVAIGICGVLLFAYGFFVRQVFNCSLLIVSIYLIVCARSRRKQLLFENAFTVLQEHIASPLCVRRILHYRVPHDTVVSSLLSLMKQNAEIHIIFSDAEEDYELPEHVLLQALLATPSATVKEAYIQFPTGTPAKRMNDD